MTTLLERLRAALAPDLEVEREIGSGGMGVVFRGRDVALDRPVAIKIIRPDRATAVAAERFLREARVLASLNHPSLIPVHRAGEAHGFFYYVMDCLEAETLEQRLARGPLAAGEAAGIASDVLAALEAIHARSVVHRDIKPGNVFLVGGRAVVGDLGVAKASDAVPPLTHTGQAVGSPGYMAPEQIAGREVGPATDVYAVALLLYEAIAGREWSFPPDVTRGDWSRIPRHLVRPLQRALAWDPQQRWPSAAAFRSALGTARAGSSRPARWWAGAAVAATAVVAAAVIFGRGPGRAGPTMLRVYLPPFTVHPAAPAWLADSLPVALFRDLRGAPDFVPVLTTAAAAGTSPGLPLRGIAELRHDSILQLTVRSDSTLGGATPVTVTVEGPARRWTDLADSLAYGLLLSLWSGAGGTLAANLPLHALPRTRVGLIAWIQAERLFARAQWRAAYDAYRQAVRLDSTCLLCRVRLTLVTRWIDLPQDSASIARYRAALDSFPAHYRRLIEASFASHQLRFSLLADITNRFRDFGLAWFIEADELFHRGPFDGYSRAEAYGRMERAAIVWPEFAPAWEHLAWIAITLGDSATASRSLDSLSRLSTGGDEYEASIRGLLDLAYRWRFASFAEAARYTDAVLQSPAVARMSSLGAAARYLLTFDTPRGAIYLGKRFEELGRPDLVTPGLLAQLYGSLILGEVDSAFATGARLRLANTTPDVDLFLAQLPAALLLADSAPPVEVRRRRPEVAAALESYAFAPGSPPLARRRAAWLLALLARRARDSAAARRYARLLAGEPDPAPFSTFLLAGAEAAAGGLDAALRATEPLVGLDSSWQAGDPFFRAMLHLSRAQWHLSSGNVAQAVRELRWHENSDLRAVGSAASAPEAAEVDWSLGTLARWYRARLHERAADTAAACTLYASVRRLWSGGDPPWAARADSAQRRLDALRCGLRT